LQYHHSEYKRENVGFYLIGRLSHLIGQNERKNKNCMFLETHKQSAFYHIKIPL
jgi:hypothetical protein